MKPPAVSESGADRPRIILGSRGSRLALAQAEWTAARIRSTMPSIDLEIRVVKTTGDRLPSARLNSGESVGLFVREIEEELLSGRIDLAVHSLKDLPILQPEGLCIAAVPVREDPRDVLVAREKTGLDGLPEGARVGTGSPRRIGQILALRRDLRFEPVRGNVDTRLRKLREGQVDALVLAAAGLNRIGVGAESFRPLPLEVILPAPGQGALALEVRTGDGELGETLRRALNDPDTAAAVSAERAFLKALGGGCQMPVGAMARVTHGRLDLEGVVASPDGSVILRDRIFDDARRPEEAGLELGRRILAAGAAGILGLSAPPVRR